MSRNQSKRTPPARAHKSPRHNTAKLIAPTAEFVGRLQAAALVGVNVQTIDLWIQKGQLRAFKPVRRVLIRRTELLALVEAAQV